MLLLGAKTNINWVNDISETPVLGHIFIFILIFVPAVICSFVAQAIIPALHNDMGFTKAMLALLPTSNLIFWLCQIRLYLFFLPSWLVLGAIAIIKVVFNIY